MPRVSRPTPTRARVVSALARETHGACSARPHPPLRTVPPSRGLGEVSPAGPPACLTGARLAPRPAVLCAVRVFAAPRANPAAVESRACGSQRCDGLLQFLCSASWSSTVRWVLSSSNTSSRCACAVVIASVSSFRVANARAGGWCSCRRRTSARPRLSTTTPSGPPVRPASHAACWQLPLRPPPSAADCILPRPMHGSDK